MKEMLMAIQILQDSSSLEHPDQSFDSVPMQPSNHKPNQELQAQEWNLACHCPRGDQELFLIAGPLPGGGIRGQFTRQPTSSQQLFLISYRREVVRQMEALHGLQSTRKLSVGSDSAKSLGCQ